MEKCNVMRSIKIVQGLSRVEVTDMGWFYVTKELYKFTVELKFKIQCVFRVMRNITWWHWAYMSCPKSHHRPYTWLIYSKLVVNSALYLRVIQLRRIFSSFDEVFFLVSSHYYCTFPRQSKSLFGWIFWSSCNQLHCQEITFWRRFL